MNTYEAMKKILEGRKGQIVTATEIKKGIDSKVWNQSWLYNPF
jgi:hypothetical protein